jgi:hypothetical protein
VIVGPCAAALIKLYAMADFAMEERPMPLVAAIRDAALVVFIALDAAIIGGCGSSGTGVPLGEGGSGGLRAAAGGDMATGGSEAMNTGGTGGGAGGQGAGGFTGGGTYSCGGGVVGTGLGGAPGPSSSDTPLNCVVGESYCSIQSLDKVPGALPTRSCVSLTGLLAACVSSPSCACICSHGVICQTNCSCSGSAGSITVSCLQI